MATKNQLTGGNFQDALGNPLAGGYLEMVLSQDAATTDQKEVAAGYTVRIDLDDTGNVVTSPAQSVWPNDVLLPTGTFYNVSGFNANGALVWGPNAQQVPSTPSPFDVGTWIPGAVNIASGGSGAALLLQTNGVNNGDQDTLNLVAGTNVTLTDSGTGTVTVAASGGGGDVLQNPTTSQAIAQPASTIFAVTNATSDTLEVAPGAIELLSSGQIVVSTFTGDGFTADGSGNLNVIGSAKLTLQSPHVVLGGTGTTTFQSDYLGIKNQILIAATNGSVLNYPLGSTQGAFFPIQYTGTAGGVVTLNLPDLDSLAGGTGGALMVIIKRFDDPAFGSGHAFTLNVTPAAGQTIDGASVLALTNLYGGCTLLAYTPHVAAWGVISKM